MNSTANLVQEVERLTQALADSNLALMQAQEVAQAANRQASATVDQVLIEMQSGGALYQPPSAMDEQRILEIAKRMSHRPWGIGSRREDAIAFAWEVLKAAPQQHAQAAQITAKDKSPLPLTDEQVIGVLHSCGIDTYPSVNGFTALQVSATSVPWVREVVRRCMVLIEAADSRVTGNDAQAALSDEVKALPNFYRDGVENGGYVLTTDVLRILATRQPAPTMDTSTAAGFRVAPVAAAVQGDAHPLKCGTTRAERDAMRDAQGDALSAAEEARRDAELYGVGFVVNGSRVEPAKVVMFRNAAQRAASKDSERDAARWRAFVGSARIKPQGSAGLENVQADNYAHMGLEIWTTFPRDCSAELQDRMDRGTELGRKWLTAYADVAVAAMAAQQSEKR